MHYPHYSNRYGTEPSFTVTSNVGLITQQQYTVDIKNNKPKLQLTNLQVLTTIVGLEEGSRREIPSRYMTE